MREIAPIVFVIKFDVYNRFFVSSSYFTSLFSKNFHMNDGFSSDLHLQILSTNFCKFFIEIFVHLFLLEVLQRAN